MIAPLKPDALEKAAREIRLARYLACSVTDEELARKAIVAYDEAVREARAPRKPRKGPAARGPRSG